MWVALSREALKTESITCGICSGSIYDLISLAECHELENLSTKPCRCLCGEKRAKGKGPCVPGLAGNAIWGQTGLSEILLCGAQRAAVPFLPLLSLMLLGLVPPQSSVCWTAFGYSCSPGILRVTA